jgi:hypothetical protein
MSRIHMLPTTATNLVVGAGGQIQSEKSDNAASRTYWASQNV